MSGLMSDVRMLSRLLGEALPSGPGVSRGSAERRRGSS